MKRVFSVAAGLLLLLLHATISSAITIGFNPPLIDDARPGGNTVEVDLVISGLVTGSGPSLGAFDLFVAFNPAAISFTRAAFGDPVHGDQLSIASDALTDVERLPSAVHILEVSLDDEDILNAKQLDTFVLATLDFVTGPFPAISDLTILNTTQFPALLVDAAGNPLANFTITQGRVNTTASPSTIPLLFAALLATIVGGCKRRINRISFR